MVLKVLSDGIVTLRSWEAADAPAIVECIDGDEEMASWLDRLPQPYTLADATFWLGMPGEEKFAVTDTDSGRLLGAIGLRWKEEDELGTVEVGYWLRRDAQRRGYMTRALLLASRHAFGAGAERIYLRADPENVASCRVAEKAGFTREGVLRSQRYNERLGKRVDFVMWSLLREEVSGRRS